MKPLFRIWPICLLLMFVLFSQNSIAQVVIGENKVPDVDAVLELVSTDKGLLLPRVQLTDLNKPDPLKEHKAGMVVYNIGDFVPIPPEEEPAGSGVSPNPNKATTDDPVYLPQGYYYNDGTKWIQITDTNIAAWRNIETQEAATSNNDNIYQTGAVVVGNADLNSHVQFSVISDSKGVLFPKLTTNDRNNIDTSVGEIPDGLIIYNIDTHCYNYYSKGAKEWISLCGSVDPAEFVIDDCINAAVAGSYKVGEALTTSHTYTIKVKVEKAGTYNIVVSTGNGYSFSKSGEFSEAGLSPTIILEGQGVPIAEGSDDVTVRFNGQIVSLPSGCLLPKITVVGNQAQYSIDCNSRVIKGDYQQGKLVSAASHYVDISVTGLQTGDHAIIQAVPATVSNGLLFRSDPVSITNGATTSVRLYASGTPTASGDFSYTIDSKPAGAQPCPFTITVTNNIGTFDNPAKSCYEIYNQLGGDSNPPSDGEYWIQRRTGSRDAVKTFCDMTRGGYTLIWSYSEKTFRELYGTPGYMAFTGHGYHISSNKPSGLITTDGSIIKYENFRLEFATMQNVKQNATKPSEYRVRIAFDPDNVNDAWGNENYFEAKPATINFDFIGTTRDGYTARGTEVATVGKLFGKDYVQNTNNLVTVFNGKSYNSFVYAYYGRTGYGNHWDAGHRMTGVFNAEVTKDDGNKKTIRVDPTTLNNIFGSIYEIDMNHHIGKCGDSEDNYGDADRYCDALQRRPHSFNGGEGRYVQWYVK